MEIGESSPDIEIILNIYRGDRFVRELEVNINSSRLVSELKEWLSEKLQTEIGYLRLIFQDTEMADARRILTYGVETDDELTLIDNSPLQDE